MVAEFLQAGPDSVVLLAVHAVQWDARSSRGRLGTFTDRWSDFVQVGVCRLWTGCLP